MAGSISGLEILSSWCEGTDLGNQVNKPGNWQKYATEAEGQSPTVPLEIPMLAAGWCSLLAHTQRPGGPWSTYKQRLILHCRQQGYLECPLPEGDQVSILSALDHPPASCPYSLVLGHFVPEASLAVLTWRTGCGVPSTLSLKKAFSRDTGSELLNWEAESAPVALWQPEPTLGAPGHPYQGSAAGLSAHY